MKRLFERVSAWFSSHADDIRTALRNLRTAIRSALRHVVAVLERLSRGMLIWFLVGLVSMIIGHFVPEFPAKCPVIYSWATGWLALGECALRWALQCIYSIFTGGWSEYWRSSTTEFMNLWQEFLTWLATI